MKLIFGHPAPQVIPLWDYFPVRAIMLNAFHISKLMDKVRSAGGVRKLFGIPDEVEVWMDSGGYQYLQRGINISVDDVIKVFNVSKPDYCMMLDKPITPSDPLESEKIIENVNTFKYMKNRVECELFAILHPVSDLEKYVDLYSSERYALGGLIPHIMHRRSNRNKGIEYLRKVRRIVKHYLHAMGLGSATMIPILKTMLYESTDTQTWRHKAAYGKIILPGRGERHITDRAINFGKKKIAEEEIKELELLIEDFRIETGLSMSYNDLKKDFTKRAIFNAWILFKLSNDAPFELWGTKVGENYALA